MLYYDRSDVPGSTDVNKNKCNNGAQYCHYWYFLNYSFKFNRISAINVMIY